MKGLKKKSVDVQKVEEDKIKKTSHVSEFSEEEDDDNLQVSEALSEDYFEKSQRETKNEKQQKRDDVREDGRWQRRDDGKSHDQESEISGKEEASSKEESGKQEKSSKENIQEKITFKHGIPKEISVFVSAKIATLPYENVDISNGITLTLPPDADHATTVLARAEAYEYCENFIALRVAEIRKALAGTKK